MPTYLCAVTYRAVKASANILVASLPRKLKLVERVVKKLRASMARRVKVPGVPQVGKAAVFAVVCSNKFQAIDTYRTILSNSTLRCIKIQMISHLVVQTKTIAET